MENFPGFYIFNTLIFMLNMKLSLAADTITPTTFIGDAISNNGNLVLLNQTNGTIWSSNMSRQIKNPVAKLLDTENVVLRDNFSSNTCEGNYLWQSFDYPSDTLLSGMKVGWNLKTALADNEDEISFRYESYNGPSIMMLKLNPSGKIQRLIWNERSSAWDVQFSAPGICDTYGICGANIICSPDNASNCDHSSNCKSGDQFVKLDDIKAPDLLEVSLTRPVYIRIPASEPGIIVAFLKLM
ncbi:hypothetical protein CUMW_163620, partial [Citrus unshiu]